MKTASGTTLVRNGRLIDGTGAPPVPAAALLIQDGRLAYAGPAAGLPELPPGRVEIDARSLRRQPARAGGRGCGAARLE